MRSLEKPSALYQGRLIFIKFMPVMDKSRHYHNWNNLFLWLIGGVASIETTEAVSSVKYKFRYAQR